MREDEDVFIMGEDIAEMGGSMGVTQGMVDEFGPERVRNTPISEMALAGAAIGAAMQGMRPVAEIMYEDFLTLATEQIVNQAAKHRYMSGGQLTVPVTFPPEDVPNGELLSGLPLPDIRGTMGTFYYFATDLNAREEGATEFGGILKRLVVDRGVARGELVGPPNPAAPHRGPGNDLTVPLVVRWNRGVKTATVEIAGQSLHLEPGINFAPPVRQRKHEA